MNHFIAPNVQRLELQEIEEGSVERNAHIQRSIDEVAANCGGTVMVGAGFTG